MESDGTAQAGRGVLPGPQRRFLLSSRQRHGTQFPVGEGACGRSAPRELAGSGPGAAGRDVARLGLLQELLRFLRAAGWLAADSRDRFAEREVATDRISRTCVLELWLYQCRVRHHQDSLRLSVVHYASVGF